MIAKLIKGSGFRGALEYDLRQSKGYLLETNMAGDDPRTLARRAGPAVGRGGAATPGRDRGLHAART